MNDILKLAREVGFVGYGEDYSGHYTIPVPAFEERLQRFADLVRAAAIPPGFVVIKERRTTTRRVDAPSRRSFWGGVPPSADRRIAARPGEKT